mgnify:CR=1 FL=1
MTLAKVQIKSEKITPFGGVFSIMELFNALLAQTIDSTMGLRSTKMNCFIFVPTDALSSTIPCLP